MAIRRVLPPVGRLPRATLPDGCRRVDSMTAKSWRTLRVGAITVEFTLPSKKPSLFDICQEIGEEMGVPFPLTRSDPWPIDIFMNGLDRSA